jgi:hypothetical protein
MERHKGSSAGWEHEGMELHADYRPSVEESPERCDNGYDHNPFGFREGIAMAHGIRRGVNG